MYKDFVGSGTLPLKGVWNTTTQDYRHLLLVSDIQGKRCQSSFDPPEGVYLHILVMDTQIQSLLTLHNQKGCYVFGELIIQISTTHLIMVSTEHWYRTDFTQAWKFWREYGDLTLSPQGSFEVPGSAPIPFKGFNIEQTHLFNSRCYLHSWYWYCWKRCCPDERDSNGVEFGAKERFVQATEIGVGSLLFDFQTTGQDQTRPLDTMETTKIQDIWSTYWFVRKVVSHKERTSLRKMEVEHSLTVVLVKETQHLRSWWWILFAIGVFRDQTSAELVAGTSIFNGTSRRIILAQTPEILQHLHCLEKVVPRRDSRDLEPYTQKDNVVYWCSSICYWIRYIQCFGGFAESTVEPSAACTIYRYHRCQRQDTYKYSKTSFHLVHSQYLGNSSSRYRLHTKYTGLEFTLRIADEKGFSERLERCCYISGASVVKLRGSGGYSPLRYKIRLCT